MDNGDLTNRNPKKGVLMTPDELFTRVHRQRADLAAVELAMDALMASLPAEAQMKWLAALQSLQSMRTAALQAHGHEEVAIAQSNQAIDRRLLRLRSSAEAECALQGKSPSAGHRPTAP
mgnify:FL=1